MADTGVVNTEPCVFRWEAPETRVGPLTHSCIAAVHYSTPHVCGCGATR